MRSGQDPETRERVRYDLPVPPWMTSCRFIHMVFATVARLEWIFDGRIVALEDQPCMFAISSNLVEDDAINVRRAGPPSNRPAHTDSSHPRVAPPRAGAGDDRLQHGGHRLG